MIGESGRGLEIWLNYLALIENSDVLVVTMGGNDLCDHPYREQPTLLMNAVVSLVGDIQNFCNRVNTRLIVSSILPRVNSSSSEVVIGQVNNRLRRKFKPHYRNFTSRPDYRGHNVHFYNNVYESLASEVVEFSKTAPGAKADKVNNLRLPFGY